MTDRPLTQWWITPAGPWEEIGTTDGGTMGTVTFGPGKLYVLKDTEPEDTEPGDG
jgi:hypothetical protein